MNPKHTWLWLTVAAALFSFIFFFERHVKKPDVGPRLVLPGLKAADIHSVLVLPRGQLPVQAERTNGGWRLHVAESVYYPAQSEQIENLLQVLEELKAQHLPPDVPNADERYGFDRPQASLMIGQRNFIVQIGSRTAPGDQVFVQVVGTEGVFLADADLLKLIPQTASEWREKALVDWNRMPFNRVVATNAGKSLELQLDPTNRLWRMAFPMPTRANGRKVEDALRRLHRLQAHQFVSDEPKPDLDAFGLQSPDLSLAFFQETNRVLLLEFGKSPTNDAGLAYARRSGDNSIVTVSKDSFDAWYASRSDNFRDYLDHHLIALPRLPERIEVRGQDSFAVQQQTNGGWRVQPQDLSDFPADPVRLGEFVGNLINLEAEIVQDVATEPDLPGYGLSPSALQYVLKAATTNADGTGTNLTIAQVDFGSKDGKVFARCAGESFVYTITNATFNQLPTASWQLRNRRVWNFTPADVVRVSIRQGGKLHEYLRKGTNSWTLAPDSRGLMDAVIAAAVEETVFRLGELSAVDWVQRGDLNREQYGFKQADYQITLELKGGEKPTVEFGNVMPSRSPYAAVVLNGETWIFEFPWPLYQYYVRQYLAVPAGNF